MKIKSAIITPMPRPMPDGMFDPMPEVVATFEDGSTKRLFSFFPDESRSSRPSSSVSPRKKPTASSNARTPPTSGHETTDPPQRHRTPQGRRPRPDRARVAGSGRRPIRALRHRGTRRLHQVRIQAVVPGLFFQPVEWIEADKLVLLPPITEYSTLTHSNPHENHHQGQRPPHRNPAARPASVRHRQDAHGRQQQRQPAHRARSTACPSSSASTPTSSRTARS